ncbi:hypothetical protein DN730_11595 [Marinomonas piezotolerans]|uniref:Uncharacterized protein n=1 Tax=Marinomonas piezotolerans TaxID=2213058 RepID=A0A370U7Q8_9GAMM|nr:hypothetical protein [Marinomonas piezotolerans]RDL43821.1 hypothetical protein DN730_11595 [Marinomonas piezotolerans]
MQITKKGVSKLVIGSVLVSQITACGTLIYPERNGQKGGKLDIGVVALDAVGLLLWFVPGVVAFGVDFITGAIYLPGGSVAQLSDQELEQLKTPDGQLDQVALQDWLISNEYLDASEVKDQKFVTQVYQTPNSLQRAVNLASDQQYAGLSLVN